MNNKEVFVEKLNLSGEIKYEMSEVHSRIIGRLKDIYETTFKREKKDFLTLKNMQYFKSGVAAPDAKAKLHEILDNFISIANHYDFLGDDELKRYLQEHGIEISITAPLIVDGPVVVSKENTKKFEKAWEFSMAGETAPGTKKEVLNMILDKALEVQKTIENQKEEIETHAENVETECQVKKPYFIKAVGIKVKELKKRSVDNEIVKMESEIESSRDIITYFDENKQPEEVVQKP